MVQSLASVFGRQVRYRATVLMVDDGSTDETWATIRILVKEVKGIELCGIKLNSNMGKNIALAVGVREVELGSYVVIMDADGQHDPMEVITMLMKSEDRGIPCIGLRTSYSRRLIGAFGVGIMRSVLRCMGLRFDPRESEFVVIPPKIVDIVRQDSQLGVAPLVSVLRSKTETLNHAIVVLPRQRDQHVERWAVSSLWQKALLHALSDPWQSLPRVAAIVLGASLISLIYGLWVGVTSVANGSFLGIGSIIVFQALLFACIIAISLMILGLLVIQHQSRIVSDRQPVIHERCSSEKLERHQ